jgi:hypothetical protein
MSSERTISDVESLFRKLERTFYRRPQYGSDQLDWVFDCAVTAWHLVDWIAHTKPGMTLRDVQSDLKTRCPQLVVCEQIANGAKHLVLGNPRLQGFDVTKHVQLGNHHVGVSKVGSPSDGPFNIEATTAVMVTDREGTTWEAMMLFLHVMTFWQRELNVPVGEVARVRPV